MGGPLGSDSNKPEIDAGTSSRTRSRPPRSAGSSSNRSRSAQRFLIELDLTELVEIEQPGVGRVSQSGSLAKVDVFVKGGVLTKDAKRPKRVLAIVRKIFSPLSSHIRIDLDTPGSSHRLLKVRFGWPMVNSSGKPQTSKRHGQLYDPGFVGAGAQSTSRSKVEKFKPVKGDAGKGVTAYVFEGAVSIIVMDYFGGKANVDGIFATAIAHELGHNLGLKHKTSPSDIMFVYAGQSGQKRKQWMAAAEKQSLGFSTTQVAAIKKLISNP